MGQDMLNITVIWRGKQLNMEVSPNCNFLELGKKLQKLTSVEPSTMRLLVPQPSSKTSKVITPFSEGHSSLSLQEMAIDVGKPIRMMGVFDDEIEEVSQNSKKSDLRILGFDEEEKRLKQRSLGGLRVSLKLPQGAYIFCDFRTLHLPGVELNPPPSEALRRMHMLACDPGIVAIMNKHRWRVGVMTEMAPEGYVGISPLCLLGFNKNQGEEISLRLRTDDLKGFRKYESIKKTLLHELAHMVYSEHDANFYALDKQLNQEAASLDWTKSRSHTLSGHKSSERFEDDIEFTETNYSGQKLGGIQNSVATARASSVAAAYSRLLNASSNDMVEPQGQTEGLATNRITEKGHQPLYTEQLPDAATEPDPDEAELKGGQVKMHAEPDPDDALAIGTDVMHFDVITGSSDPYTQSSVHKDNDEEPDPDDCLDRERMFEPDPDDSRAEKEIMSRDEPDPDDSRAEKEIMSRYEPDPDDSRAEKEIMSRDEPDPDDSRAEKEIMSRYEPDPDDFEFGGGSKSNMVDLKSKNNYEPDPDDMLLDYEQSSLGDFTEGVAFEASHMPEPHSDSLQAIEISRSLPVADDHMNESDSQELQRIEEPVAAICTRLQKAIEMLRSELTPAEATSALQILFKIIRNVIDHPNEMKFRRLRKANPQFQRNVANHKAAMELLTVAGFCEDVISDEVGRAETYLVLKRNDPGLLWLAKSSLEACIA